MQIIKFLKIGTRGSKLALTQSKIVQERLKSIGINSELVIVKTTGDKILDKPLYDIGGKALFLKELEEALFAGEIDIAVHSMKDVPGKLPEGLEITAVLEREDPRDVFISKYSDIYSLPKGAKVGTSSVRRIAQIKEINPHLQILNLRGNIDSRINRYLSGEFDAIILAYAGIRRLKIEHSDFKVLAPQIMVPAAGQGVIAIETKSDNLEIKNILSRINHEQTWLELSAERGFLETLEGDCRTPLGALGSLQNDKLHVSFFLANDDGSSIRKIDGICNQDDAYKFGQDMALKLKQM